MQHDARLHRRPQFWVMLVLGLMCAAASANIWLGPGILNTHAGGDSPFLLIRVHELVANLRAGIFPARWMPNAAQGLGYPFFNFYASLPYYLAGVLNLLGFDLLTAIKLTQTLGMLGAAASMWMLARQFLPPLGAMLAAAAYTLTPFHLVNIYVRGDSLSEFWAFVWYPVILWAVLRLAGGGARHRFWGAIPGGPFAILVVSLAALVLTHNVSAVLFAPFILIWSVACWLGRATTIPATHRRDLLLAYIMAAFLALCLSAWFWLPALGEVGSVQLNNQTTGYFNFANHFRDGNLVQPAWAFDYSVGSDAAVFAMGLVQTILIGAGIVAGLWRLRAQLRARTSVAEANALKAPAQFGLLLGCFVLATLFITSLSAWVWTNAPLLPLAQFPWRFLSVQAVFAALLIGQLGYGGKGEGDNQPLSPSPLPLPLIAILAVTSLINLPNERLNVRAEDVTPLSVQLYEWHTGNIGTTIRAEYLPKTMQPWPRIGFDLMGQPHRAISTHAEDGMGEPVTAQLISSTPQEQTWHVLAETEFASFVLPMLASAGWELEPYAETPAERAAPRIGPYGGSGWQVVELFGGEHRVTLRYIGTPLQHWGELVSLVTALLGLVVFAASDIQFNRRWLRQRAKGIGIDLAGIGLTLLVVLGIAQGVRWLQPSAEPSMQALDNTARLFPHRGPLTLISSGTSTTTYELIGAQITPTLLRAGDPFTLTLRWKDNRAPAQIVVRQEFPNPSAYVEQQQLFRFQNLVSSGDAQLSVHHTITEALPGPTLLRLSLDPGGEDVGGMRAMIVGPTITDTPANAPSQVLHTFANGITLHQADILRTTERDACFRAVWSRTNQPMADALQVSMRVYGDDGREIALADWQPLAGLAPTWAWPPNAAVYDSKCNVPIISPLRPNENFTVRVVWYYALSLQEIDSATLQGKAGPAQEGFVVLPLSR